MSAKGKKTTARKSRQRATRDLPLDAAKRPTSVKAGHTGGILVAMGDGSVRMGDGSVRFIKDGVTTTVWR